jgi:hypothetical protein
MHVRSLSRLPPLSFPAMSRWPPRRVPPAPAGFGLVRQLCPWLFASRGSVVPHSCQIQGSATGNSDPPTWASPVVVATGGKDDVAGDPPGVVGGEEGGDRADVLGVADATEGCT